MDRSIATIIDGKIVLSQPVDWPDGTSVEVTPIASPSNGDTWPASYFDQTAGALAGEDFDQPEQGELPSRDCW